MALRSELRTRLQRRLGLGVVSAIEQERLNEALNSGIARAVSDGVPGLSHDTFVGSVYGEMALTGGATITCPLGGTTFTFVGGDNPLTSNVYPHDILQVVITGTTTKFLLRDVKDANEVDIGAPATQGYTGDANSTVIRRSIPLPTTGQVVGVYRHSASSSDGLNTRRLTHDPIVARQSPFKTGTPKHYEQRFSEGQSKSFISLWPAPTSVTDQFTVVQMRYIPRLTADSDTLIFPEEALDAILERARMAYITWAGTHAPTTLALANEAIRDTADSLKNTSNTRQIVTKE